VRRLAPLALVLALLVVPAARAADPTMPLTAVHAGMHCTGLTVVRGTTISSFDADVIDVVDRIGSPTAEILIRVSGPAVDVTGIAEGFSGSPIYCKDGNGVARNVGAIAYGLGDYGNKLGLVTPIRAILDEPVTPPAHARRLTRREVARIRPLAPLTVAGLTPWLAQRVTSAARRQGRTLYSAPAGPLGTFPPQQLKPGASLAVGLSNGDLALSAVGTVTYAAGRAVWGFGHPLDLAGSRRLFLQDAYVYTVVNNPNGDFGVSYKLAAPGHDLGALSGDYLNAVTGRIGPLPPSTNLTIHATDLDTGKTQITNSHVADELELGSNIGISPLGIVAPIGVIDAGIRLLQSDPGRTTARMCLRGKVTGHARILRFCNRYVGDASLAGPAGTLAAGDVDQAALLLESVQFPGMRLESLSADLKLQRGLAQAFLTSATARHRVRAGRKLRVTVRAKVVRSATRPFSFAVPVPRHVRPGFYELVVSGPGPDGTDEGDSGGGGGDITQLLNELFGTGGGGASDLGPTSFGSLARQFARIRRYDGLTATLLSQESDLLPSRRRARDLPAAGPSHVYVNRALRIGGTLTLPVRVTRRGGG
jgi:hypothetical protein